MTIPIDVIQMFLVLTELFVLGFFLGKLHERHIGWSAEMRGAADKIIKTVFSTLTTSLHLIETQDQQLKTLLNELKKRPVKSPIQRKV